MNMEKLAVFLSTNGYDVWLLVDDHYPLSEDVRTSTNITVVKYPLLQYSDIVSAVDNVFNLEDMLTASPLRLIRASLKVNYAMCSSLLYSKPLLDNMKTKGFDMIVIDDAVVCNFLVSSYLDLPMITFQVLGLGRLQNPDIPSLPSYVPESTDNNFTPDMSFLQRAENTLNFVLKHFVLGGVFALLPRMLQYQYDITDVKDREVLRFVNDDFSIAYPSPIMPDMVFMAGAFFKTPKPLSQELADFVHGSGEHGIVIFSLGTLVHLREGRFMQLFLNAFSKLNQRVLFHYKGERLKNVPSNIMIVDWLPLTDLLADTRTKVFVTHCGLNSAMEAAYYGVPIVAVPIYGDNMHHAARLTRYHKMGIYLNIRELTSDVLQTAIKSTIYHHVYKMNALKLSAMFKESQKLAKDKILFWVDFVQHTNGSSHLISHARKLPWYQYYLLDVILLFVTIGLCGWRLLCYFTYLCYTALGSSKKHKIY